MSTRLRGTVPILVGAAALTVAWASVVPNESGSALFRSYCASCHGVGAKGDGPLAANLRVAPADLTRIAKRNRGKFDAEKVRRAIDGRSPKEIHGGSDMPVWGDAFKRAGEGERAHRRAGRLPDHAAGALAAARTRDEARLG